VPRHAPRTSSGDAVLAPPNDGELANWSAHLHRKNTLPGITTAGTFPASSEDTAAILQSIAGGISHTSEEAENQNKIQREQLDYLKVKDAKKENKAEKWHATNRRLVLNAVSTDGYSPANKIPESFLRIINSKTAGMADKELQAQMSGLGHANVGFAHGLVGECLKFEDWSMVNDRLVCFNKVFEMVSTINVILPPNFIKPNPMASPISTDVMSPDGDGKKKKGKKRKSGDAEGERITKNPAPSPSSC
jgi:hypothetical protein